jgi:enterochelin esterase family protein
MKKTRTHFLARACAAAALCLATAASAQPPQGQAPPPVTSPEIRADRRITFRLLAPRATAVRLNAGDIPNLGPGAAMTKGDNGVWETTVGPVEPGAYRYNFNVDGLTVTDPRNPATSESVSSSWSLAVAPGSEWFDTKDVRHGAVAEVTYHSPTVGGFRRMHVYTPPGYESGKGRYPVFYLLHGAGDSDDSWSTVGRAGFILDNLIAAGRAKPMIVVMPAGHTRSFGFGPPPSSGPRPPADEFEQDFVNHVMPHVERNYRVLPGRANRAIAGLSMGGGQTLNIAIPHLEKFAYFGVFSSGAFGAFPFRPGGAQAAPTGARSEWEERHLAKLQDAGLKRGLKLVWFGIGTDDFLLQISRNTVEMLKKYGFNVENVETSGGHTWLKWRDYLAVFAPRLFR